MAGYVWTEDEQALVMWFASIGLNHITITRLLLGKGFKRSMLGVRTKIAEIRRRAALGNTSHEMNPEDVDNWIRRICAQLDIASLLRPTIQDQQIVKVRRSISNWDKRLICDLGMYRH
jgi:hypothetical protein